MKMIKGFLFFVYDYLIFISMPHRWIWWDEPEFAIMGITLWFINVFLLYATIEVWVLPYL
jgi:hypothetical protein